VRQRVYRSDVINTCEQKRVSLLPGQERGGRGEGRFITGENIEVEQA